MDWPRKKRIVGDVEFGSLVRRFPSARTRIARNSHDLNLTGRHIPSLPLYMKALYTQIWHTMPSSPGCQTPRLCQSDVCAIYEPPRLVPCSPAYGGISPKLCGRTGLRRGHDDDEHDQNKRFPGSSTRLANATTAPCLALPQRDFLIFHLSLTDSSMMTATATISQTDRQQA